MNNIITTANFKETFQISGKQRNHFIRLLMGVMTYTTEWLRRDVILVNFFGLNIFPFNVYFKKAYDLSSLKGRRINLLQINSTQISWILSNSTIRVVCFLKYKSLFLCITLSANLFVVNNLKYSKKKKYYIKYLLLFFITKKNNYMVKCIKCRLWPIKIH